MALFRKFRKLKFFSSNWNIIRISYSRFSYILFTISWYFMLLLLAYFWIFNRFRIVCKPCRRFSDSLFNFFRSISLFRVLRKIEFFAATNWNVIIWVIRRWGLCSYWLLVNLNCGLEQITFIIKNTFVFLLTHLNSINCFE